MELSFSQRIGKKPSIKAIQFEMDDELKNRLWNFIRLHVLDSIPKYDYAGWHTEFSNFVTDYWLHFGMPLDRKPSDANRIDEIIRAQFYNQWNEAFEIIEYLAHYESNFIDSDVFIEDINKTLEREFSAYRFVNGLIAPISNLVEIKAIEIAIEDTLNLTPVKGANIHLTKALGKLSDRDNPDYTNSIKESILAIETVFRVLTGETTLGKALNKIDEKGIKLNSQFKSGLEKIYSYTNSKETGIRHAIMEEHKSPDFDDAKYMLVMCSSFINYILGKCKTHNISF
jgi:hypothetical protein